MFEQLARSKIIIPVANSSKIHLSNFTVLLKILYKEDLFIDSKSHDMHHLHLNYCTPCLKNRTFYHAC